MQSDTTQPDAPRPPNFTGKWKGQHYYKGHLWLGPTNLMGHSNHRPKFVMIEAAPGQFGIRALGAP